MHNFFDVIIVGGGLGGLAAGIQLAKNGLRVAVFEKKAYPFHKVCGEYLSLESYDFLCSLGVPLPPSRFPRIERLRLTAPSGFEVSSPLPLGAVGASRYYLDATLAEAARQAGVALFENTRVLQVEERPQEVVVQTAEGNRRAAVALLAHGKYHLRGAVTEAPKQARTYIGVKYHIPASVVPAHTIELHTFKGGYLGSSQVEDGKACLCYLADRRQLKNRSIDALETAIMQENPQTRVLLKAQRLGKAVTVSQVVLGQRRLGKGRLFFLGDSAGVIAPLCGNGMSMALHASYLLVQSLDGFFRQNYSLAQARRLYERQWKARFGLRMRAGNLLQPLLSVPWLTEAAVRSIGTSRLLPSLIRLTHGKAIPVFHPQTQTL